MNSYIHQSSASPIKVHPKYWWPNFRSFQIFGNDKIWTILPTQSSQYKLSVMQFSENLHWDFTTRDSKRSNCWWSKMGNVTQFNVERTKDFNPLIMCLPFWTNIIVTHVCKIFAEFFFFWPLFLGHTEGACLIYIFHHKSSFFSIFHKSSFFSIPLFKVWNLYFNLYALFVICDEDIISFK